MKKILIVDDEPSLRWTLKLVVEDLGYTAIQCSSGKQALSMLEMNLDISLVISDLMMPEMNGREFIEAKNKIEELAKIPVIMISGVVKLSEVSDILEKGVSRFIAKPVRVEELEEYINQLLE